MWENLGWHWAIRNGGIQVMPSCGAFFGEIESGGEQLTHAVENDIPSTLRAMRATLEVQLKTTHDALGAIARALIRS